MPRIHKPSQTAISANPRAYAIYKQAVPSSGDVVDDEVGQLPRKASRRRKLVAAKHDSKGYNASD